MDDARWLYIRTTGRYAPVAVEGCCFSDDMNLNSINSINLFILYKGKIISTYNVFHRPAFIEILHETTHVQSPKTP
jgi:hypothetical protein